MERPRLLPESPKARRLFVKLLLLVGSTVVSLLIAEGLCRVLIPPRSNIRFQQDVDELDGLRLDEASRMIENDPELFWKLRPETQIVETEWPFFGVVSNGQSLREDHDISLDKPQEQIRILFLGDSCTYGYGVAHEASFVEQVERQLAQRTERSVECINAGVPGYTLFQGWRFLEIKGLAYQPDLVVLTFGWNDAGMWDSMGDIEHHALMRKMQPPGHLKGSRLCQLLWGHWNRPQPADLNEQKRPRLTPDEFASILDRVDQHLSKQNIPVLTLVWPMQSNADPQTPPNARTPYQAELLRFGQQHALSDSPRVEGVLDLVPTGRSLLEKHGVHAVYYDHGHVTPLAHEAIGEAIADYLAPLFGE